MPNDATMEILAGLTEKQTASIRFIAEPTWNIDDMDPRFCMINLMFSGMYCLASSKNIDPSRPGMIYLDGEPTEPPVISPLMPMFGQIIGIRARKYFTEYDRTYAVRYTGAYDTDGMEIPEFSFTVKTLSKHEPGEKWPEHDEVVLDAARESAVLLKNEHNALPLGKRAVVNVFGAGAVVFRPGCLGAGKINPRYFIRVKDGIEKYSSLYLNEELYRFYMDEENTLPPVEMLERAKKMSDTAVIFLSRTSSEAHDNLPEKGQYYLTDEERALVESVRRTFSKVVAVLNVAYPIETGWTDMVDAVLLVGLPGMAGGRALAEILEGTVNPSGRLSCTWAKDYWDYPASKNFLTLLQVRKKCPDAKFVTTVYEEGLYVGYRYFDSFGKEPAFRFGFGLSYTDFTQTGNCHGSSVEVVVTNTGKVPGKDVVQIYAKLPQGKLEQPEKRLVAFAKTAELAPCETQIMFLEITEEALRSFDEETGAWIMEAGTITLYLGDRVVGELVIPETKVLKQSGGRIAPPIPVRELSRMDGIDSYPTGKDTKPYQEETLPFACGRKQKTAYIDFHKPDRLITFPEVQKDPALAEVFVAQLSDYALARLAVGGRTGWDVGDVGFAGTLFAGGELEKYKLPNYYFCDGNNGVIRVCAINAN